MDSKKRKSYKKMNSDKRLYDLRKELMDEEHADFWDWDKIYKLRREIKSLELDIINERV